MKKIFLYAYSINNLGDDLFILSILRRYPKTKILLRKNNFSTAPFQAHKNFITIKEENLFTKIAKQIRPSFAARLRNYQESRCEVTVYIGGSIFIEYDHWATILTWWDYVARHRKFYVLGANFGPWHTEEYLKKLDIIFSNMQDVCFRDRYSKALFLDNSKVRYAPDILLGYPMPKAQIEDKRAFISLIDCESKDEGDNQLSGFDKTYVDSMAKLTQWLIDRDWKVVLSSFCKAEGDEKGVQKVLKKLKDASSVEIKNYDGTNMDEILCEMAKASIIYGSRFHAVILGFAARRPVVPIIYSDKTTRVLEDLHFSGKTFDLRKFDDKSGLRMAEAALHLDCQFLSEADRYAKQSEDHFLVLDRVLK